MPKRSDDRPIARGRWYLPAAAFFVLVLGQPLALGQRVQTRPLSGTGGAAGGVGGGAGHVPTMPDFTPVPVAPAAPTVAPPVLAPAAPAPSAAVPAPIIRLRCEVAPGDSSCRGAPAPDGGGDSETCDCARDLCYNDGAGKRICEKP